ncbi:hypothetical protein RD792_009527 [Penstemon davidsonii]|uniref:Cytochrome P450 n=1 Tax=Penstemon davidsonii TaxID=160366 RepID=A0ABR0CZB7_9LAMI|nr:hypothetical protein RD792_009527 [Penstemon davidsonii]
MFDLHFSTSLMLCISVILPGIFLILAKFFKNPSTSKFPKSYPIFGSFFTILKNRERFVQWTSEIVTSTPNLTFPIKHSFGRKIIITANPANVQHILKSQFHIYNKGDFFTTTLRDFLGDGIFNADGDKWKFQRQVSSHEFNTKSLRKFVEHVVDYELTDRLIPILKNAAAKETVFDFQDILQRFAFDNICKIAFGYDPEYLSPSLPQEKFAVAFEQAVKLSSERFNSLSPYFWKIKRALNIGSEKQLKIAINQIREFAKQIITKKKQDTQTYSVDLLSRFLSSGHSDEDFVTDIIISFILAGRDTTSAALTWFFWLLSNHPEVEIEILREIGEKSESEAPASAYDEVKDMVYTHAALCESMRLYPPVPIDTKAVVNDDILPDGTVVKKGMRVTYHPYAMGRVEKVWGGDWAEFRPTRWLQQREGEAEKWSFVNRDPYTYPVFQAGPRICLGKEMAFLQMKRVVAGVVRRFKVVPVVEQGVEPVFLTILTAKMKGGFPVRIQERAEE